MPMHLDYVHTYDANLVEGLLDFLKFFFANKCFNFLCHVLSPLGWLPGVYMARNCAFAPIIHRTCWKFRLLKAHNTLCYNNRDRRPSQCASCTKRLGRLVIK